MEIDINSLAQDIGDLMQENRLTLAVAESCTGGLLGTYMTNIPGTGLFILFSHISAKSRSSNGNSRTLLPQAAYTAFAIAAAAGPWAASPAPRGG